MGMRRKVPQACQHHEQEEETFVMLKTSLVHTKFSAAHRRSFVAGSPFHLYAWMYENGKKEKKNTQEYKHLEHITNKYQADF
jgi:hypothetical protein